MVTVRASSPRSSRSSMDTSGVFDSRDRVVGLHNNPRVAILNVREGFAIPGRTTRTGEPPELRSRWGGALDSQVQVEREVPSGHLAARLQLKREIPKSFVRIGFS